MHPGSLRPATPKEGLSPAAWIGLTLAGLLGILFTRRPEMFLRPQFWAEDGPIFFVQADVDGWKALLQPSGGYHHLLLRLIAAAASPFLALHVPAAYFSACFGVTLGLGAAIFSPRIDLTGRPACALALGLVPHTGEVMGTLTNLQWIAALGLVWLLLARDATTPRQRITDPLVAGVLGLTGVFSVLLTPLFVARAAWLRSRESVILAVVTGCAAAVQVITLIKTGETAEPSGGGPDRTVLEAIGHRLGAGLLLPANIADRVPLPFMTVAGLLCLGALVAVAVWPGERRRLRFMLAAAIVLIVAGTLFRLRPDLWQLDRSSQGDRYFFLPKLLAGWLLIQGLARPGWRRWLGGLGCAAALGASLIGWRYELIRNLDWPRYARRIDAGEAVRDIPLNPDGAFSHPGRH